MEVYHPAKGAAGNCSPPASNIMPATIGSAYHSNLRSSMAFSLKWLPEKERLGRLWITTVALLVEQPSNDRLFEGYEDKKILKCPV